MDGAGRDAGPVTTGDGSARLRRFLCRAGVDAEIVNPGTATPTVELAAAALGVRPAQIIKSLLFCDRKDGAVLVIVRGDRRIDRRKLAEVSGLRGLELAKPHVVESLTGYRVGGVPPVGHVHCVPTILDRAVLDTDLVYGGGGTDDSLLRIEPEEIKRLTDALVADVCETP
jgi:Cys-tRNA(Pro) deacylase